MNLSDSPRRPACPSRASGWSSLTTPWGLPCCVRFPCVHAVATTPAQRLGVLLCSFTQPYQPSPKGLSGRPAHCPFRGLLGVYSRYGLHTRAVTVYRDTLTEGFSHFVTSMTAPVASGWSTCRVGLTPTGKRRLSTAHTHSRPRGNGDCALERSFSWCEVRGERLQRSCQGGAAPLGVGGARKEDESRRHERFVVPRFICRVLSRFEPFNRKRLCLNCRDRADIAAILRRAPAALLA